MMRKMLVFVPVTKTKITHTSFIRSFTTHSPFFNNIDSSKLTIEKATTLKPLTPNKQLLFGRTFTDHMLEVDHVRNKGWTAPRIVPFQNLSLHPAASCLHYALEAFEGMKAYISPENKILMFRPDKNMERFNSSLHRLRMPAFNGEELVNCMKELIKLDKRWIPAEMGYSLYIRPTAISTTPWLGVGPAEHTKIFVILCPVGPYYAEGFNPVKLYADPKNVRAWPGGVGNIKCGGNYAMSIDAQMDAQSKGYAQVLWLFGDDHQVTEVGTMNQFFFWHTRDGKKELVTAPLDGTILPGVTRDSILQLTASWGEFDVVERHYTIHDIVNAVKEKRMIEAFGAGTAAIISPVKGFFYDGQEYEIPLVANDPSAKAGHLAQRLTTTLMNIQYGKTKHPWSVIVD